jgi:hypothetical protein
MKNTLYTHRNTGFYYYLNYPNSKVTIHEESCRFCNYGLGVQNNIHGNKNGVWSQRYPNIKETVDGANTKIKKTHNQRTIVIKNCKVCNPQ